MLIHRMVRDDKPEVFAHTLTLPHDVAEALQKLSRDASDSLGQSIDDSVIIRVLVRQVIMRGSWAADSLFLDIEGELNDKVP